MSCRIFYFMSYCSQYYVEYFFFSLLFEIIPSIFHQKNEIIVSIIIVQSRNKNVYFNDRN